MLLYFYMNVYPLYLRVFMRLENREKELINNQSLLHARHVSAFKSPFSAPSAWTVHPSHPCMTNFFSCFQFLLKCHFASEVSTCCHIQNFNPYPSLGFSFVCLFVHIAITYYKQCFRVLEETLIKEKRPW